MEVTRNFKNIFLHFYSLKEKTKEGYLFFISDCRTWRLLQNTTHNIEEIISVILFVERVDGKEQLTIFNSM